MNDEKEKMRSQGEILYSFICDFAKLKLDNEIKREDSLIQQSATMQTAFSFSTAALFMIAPIVVEYRGNMSLRYLLIVFSSITACLLLSLLFACIAQNRRLNATFPDVNTFTTHIEKYYSDYISKAQQDKALSELIATVQKNKDEINDKRVNFIRWSMLFFYIALGLSVMWFSISLIILFK